MEESYNSNTRDQETKSIQKERSSDLLIYLFLPTGVWHQEFSSIKFSFSQVNKYMKSKETGEKCSLSGGHGRNE